MSKKLINSFIASLVVISTVSLNIPHTMALDSESAVVEGLIYQSSTLVELELGTLEGKLVEGVLIYTGVPYAQAPVGELRWKAPVDLEPWDGVYDATIEGVVATQLQSGEIIGSEDCLNLDIYRPDTDEQDLPILVYLHGGNNQTGASADIDASTLALETNSVVISLNYRLGALGFVNLPALKTDDALENSGNFTLLDIHKALEWININGEKFGADVNNITVSGYSAGGRDVMAMLISPLFEGTFHKAISFSGGMTVADYEQAQQINASAFATLVVEDGVQESLEEAVLWLQTDDVEVRDYLYSLTDERIATLMSGAAIRMEVFPHLFTDGVVLPADGFDAEYCNDVPIIMLASSSEFSIFGISDNYFASADEIDQAELDFVLKYGNQLYELFNAEESAIRMSDSYNSNIYLCDIAYGATSGVVSEELEAYGAYHGIFLPFLTGNLTSMEMKFLDDFQTDDVYELTTQFLSYIKHFLWTGDPNSDDLTHWDVWSADSSSNNQLIFDITADGVLVEMVNERISSAQVLQDIEEDLSITDEAKAYLLANVLNGRWFSSELDSYFAD